MLLQEVLLEGHPWGATEQWRMLVGCVFLNQTSRKQADGVWPAFFERWPGPYQLADADEEELAELVAMLRPLGLQHRRAAGLVKLATAWTLLLEHRGTCVETVPLADWELRELPGIGDYAIDSYAIFVRDELDRQPQDKELRKHLDGVQASSL